MGEGLPSSSPPGMWIEAGEGRVDGWGWDVWDGVCEAVGQAVQLEVGEGSSTAALLQPDQP